MTRSLGLILMASLALQLPSASSLAAPAPYSAKELRELQRFMLDLARFKRAAQSYRATVNGIVKRAYEHRRKGMLSKYDKKITALEKEERTRRIAAITLFEDFLRRYPNDRRWTPDVIFRLAELYFEKSNDEYLLASEKYDKALKRFERKEIAKAPPPPKQDYSQTVALHRRLIREFPRYRLVDGAYYLLGYCLSEMGEFEKGNQAFLALICSGQYKAPLSNAPAAPPPAETKASALATATPDGEPQFDTSVYDKCQPMFPKSRFNAEAWTRIGEYHFDANELGKAIAAYRRVIAIGAKNNPYYDEALYKLAWTYYRADKFTEAISHFDKVVVYADKERARTGKAGSDMRPEAVQYLGVSFAEEDWDNDQKPDPETGLQRIEKFYAGRYKEKHVYEVYKRLGTIYFDTAKRLEAIAVFKLMLKRWPYHSENPDLQDKIITALERERSAEQALAERERFTKLFGKGTEWEKRNRNNPKALKKAQDYDEQMLIQAAVFHHKAGKALRKRGLAMSDVAMLKRASQEYALAAKAYMKYIERFPNTKNSYEIRFSYASCLYYSQRFVEAAKIYEAVRDSNLDNRYQEDAAHFAVLSYQEQIKLLKSKGQLTEPPLPTDKLKNVKKKTIPPAFLKYQKALDAYATVLPNNARTPRFSYKAAEIAYRFIHFAEARKRFKKIYKKHCKTAMATNAGQAILVTFQLQKNLDKMEEWATKLSKGKCGGKAGGGGTVATGAKKLLVGIKFKKAEALFKKAEGLYNAGKKREAAPFYDKAAAAYLKLVKQSPNSSDADKALFNAGVAYEKSMRFESATRIYERVWQKYRKSPLAGQALWLAAQNYKKFFEFKKAVGNYLILADAPRFANHPHRTDAIFNAAVILENDQDYAKAATLYLRYASQVGKPKDAADAYFTAGEIYGKMKNFGQMVKVLRAFPNKYGSVPGQRTRAVEAVYRIAKAADARKLWTTARKYYRQTIQEYNTRRHKPASDAAEYAAEAAFLLAEKKLEAFLKLSLKTRSLKVLMRKKKKLEAKAKALKKEYDAILKYKRARWVLAVLYRRGSIFEHVARAVGAGFRALPVPRKVKKLGPEAVDIYMGQLDQALEREVGPLEKATKNLYKACVAEAKKRGLSNKYTEEAERRLNALDPAAYPLLKRPKYQLIFD